MVFEPIGIFQCAAQYPYDAARQAEVAAGGEGMIELNPGCNYEQALQDLAGFSRIWLIYLFDRNTHWKPLTRPPRSPHKVGLFASRAPYRPNPIGLSCVQLCSVQGRRVYVGAHDLLDGTPILDIKPYIPYADSFPDAGCGWLDVLEEEAWQVEFSESAQQQVDWLEQHGAGCIQAFLVQQLRDRPFDTRKKRVSVLDDTTWEIAYRTWRIAFQVNEALRYLTVDKLYSGYTLSELEAEEDPYQDKAVHKAFCQRFGDRAGEINNGA